MSTNSKTVTPNPFKVISNIHCWLHPQLVRMGAILLYQLFGCNQKGKTRKWPHYVAHLRVEYLSRAQGLSQVFQWHPLKAACNKWLGVGIQWKNFPLIKLHGFYRGILIPCCQGHQAPCPSNKLSGIWQWFKASVPQGMFCQAPPWCQFLQTSYWVWSVLGWPCKSRSCLTLIEVALLAVHREPITRSVMIRFNWHSIWLNPFCEIGNV